MMHSAHDRHLAWQERATNRADAPLVEPPLPPRAEAIVLLQAVAEVEHALMVQYLYAAYSLRSPYELTPEEGALVDGWRKILLGVAREEMGHLLTVQNALRFLGGAINLERQGYPFISTLYPFPFTLEPLSRASVAKYVIAEMPEDPSVDLTSVRAALQHAGSTETSSPHRIGHLYARVVRVLSDVDEAECLTNPSYLEGLDRLWRGDAHVLVPKISSLADARRALEQVAEQGEGGTESQAVPSHFRRLLGVFNEIPAGGEAAFVRPVPTDPTLVPDDANVDDTCVIRDPRARKWAQLFNLRYALLLGYIGHALTLDPTSVASDEATRMRQLLIDLAFEEMRWMGAIGRLLPTMSRGGGAGLNAAATFDLPLTLDMPTREIDLWRGHRAALQAAESLLSEIGGTPDPAQTALAAGIEAANRLALSNCDLQIVRWQDDPKAPVIVVGAGPAGLAAALTLTAHAIPVRVLEASPLLGGKVHSSYQDGRSLEHGVHGWWMNYLNFDALLRAAGVDLEKAFKTADGSSLVLADGRRSKLSLLPISVPSPLHVLIQTLRSPFLGITDCIKAIPFVVHALAFEHGRDYPRYDGLTFQQLLDRCGVSPTFQEIILRTFILSFDFTTPDRVSAACGLSGLQFYVLHDQRSILARWSRRIPAVTVYEPMAAAIERQGGTISREKPVTSLVISHSRVRAAKTGGTAGMGPVSVVATVPLGAVPDMGYAPVPQSTLWVGRFNGSLRALDGTCAHMGCPTEWLTEQAAFECPCHGSRFDGTGAVTAGPATRALRELRADEADGRVQVLDEVVQTSWPTADIVLATDLEATKRILRNSDDVPIGLMRDLDRLDTCNVIVVRLWFPSGVAVALEESGVAAGFAFIDNFFFLNAFDLDAPAQGDVVEVQAYRVDGVMDQPDAHILDLVFKDLSTVNARLVPSAMTHAAINRHRGLFTRFGPGQHPFRPQEQTEVQGLYLAGDWTRADSAVWMQERAIVSGMRAANAILSRRGLATVPIEHLPRENWLLRSSRRISRLLLRMGLFRVFDAPVRVGDRH